jgi:hypothetical protein
MTSCDHSIIDDNSPNGNFAFIKAISASCKAFHEVLVCERIYHSVEREFANFKFSGTFALVNLCGTTSLLTAKYNFKSYICFMSDKLLQALITLPICACSMKLPQLAQNYAILSSTLFL